jgi:endonuclease/exonuclease/phosphatase family metal-dependent hydrolase
MDLAWKTLMHGWQANMAREVIRDGVADMEPPSEEMLKEARQQGRSRAFSDDAQANWPCFRTLELAQPPQPLPLPTSLIVAAWNMERCKTVEASAELIRKSGADVVLATEMDWGMARSGMRHTTRDLARCLGFGYAFGVEFVELSTGDAFETSRFADVPNKQSLHGNAILSRLPLEAPALIPIDDGGNWFVNAPKNDGQLRIGGRMAMAARIGGLTFASVHYESESDAEGRRDQTSRLISALDQTYGSGPAVIGGDLNTSAFSETGMDAAGILCHPAKAEPCFDTFAAADFDWKTCNLGQPTTRAAPGRPVAYPLKTLDWLFSRAVDSSEPKILPAVSATGHYLSDHELIAARVLL